MLENQQLGTVLWVANQVRTYLRQVTHLLVALKRPSGQNQITAYIAMYQDFLTNGPGRTKDVYDIIIKEARKELSVILFVFKWGRIDESIYERVKMLFDELKKTKAAKVLIINDMSNYGFSECPTEADYQSLADHIKNGTALEFNYVFTFTGNTLVTEVESLKKTLLGCQAYASPNLK